MASKSNATPTTTRTFARITAVEMTQNTEEQNEQNPFLSMITTVHPEPEIGLL